MPDGYEFNPWESAGTYRPYTKRIKMRYESNMEIRKRIAKEYGIDVSKVQIDTNRTTTPGNYIVTIIDHPKPKFKVGNKTFIVS